MSKLIADFDAMIVEPVEIRLLGFRHVIKPLSFEQFIRYTSALGELYELRKKPEITQKEMVQKYFNLVTTVIPTITEEDINKMTPNQMAGLIQVVLDTIAGKTFVDEMYDEKKKFREPKETSIPIRSVSRGWFPKFVRSLGGR